MRPETEPWWRQAEAETALARQLINPDAYFASAWFAHQAVEKGLKALMIGATGQQAPRTHDLLSLGMALALPHRQIRQVAVVDPAFKFTWYPDIISGAAPADSVTEAIAVRILAAAEEVMTWLGTQLQPPSIHR